MARKRRLNICQNYPESQKLKKYAKSKDLSMSEFLRDYVKSKPEV